MTHPYQSKWIKANNELVKTEHGVKIDFSSGIFNTNLGHNNQAVKSAIIEQLNKGFTNTYRHPTAIRDKYIEVLKSFFGAKGVFLFSTGAEAVEAAFRMAPPSIPPITMVVDGFHGKTRAAFNYDGRPQNIHSGNPPLRHGPRGGIILEPYRPYDARWHTSVWIEAVQREFSTIIFDEVQSAFYRTGTKLAFYRYDPFGFQPDYVILGKAMGNGFPMSAVLSFVESVRHEPLDSYSSTYGGNPLACAAGLAVIATFQKLIYPDRWVQGKEETVRDYFPNANGHGLCLAVECTRPGQEETLVRECFRRGVIVIPTGKGWIKLAPPLTIREKYLIHGLKKIKEALHVVS